MKKRNVNVAYACAAVLPLGILFIKNYQNNGFWDASCVQILTLALTAFVSFFLVQRLADKRRKIDFMEHVIAEIQNVLEHDKVIFSLDREALGIQSSIGNKLLHLQNHSFAQIKGDIDYIYSEFTELREMYAAHYQDPEGYELIKKDMDRHIHKISNKCDKIRLTLYDI